jgi:hypothetical protein
MSLASNQRPDRYELLIHDEKLSDPVGYGFNRDESASMQFQWVKRSCVPFACREQI